MIRFISLIFVTIAAAVIAAGGVILFYAAWHSTGIEWQRPYIASFVLALAVWEAGAITAAAILWKHGFKPLAPFALVMLLAATAFTARYDILNQISSQSDRIASRTVTVDRSKSDVAQLSALAKQQATWAARIETAQGRELRDIRERLDKINAQIAEINLRINARPAVLEAAPDAAFMSRVLAHGTEKDWIDILALMMILALPIGRIVLTPIAVAFWQIAWRREIKAIASVTVPTVTKASDTLPTVTKADTVTEAPKPDLQQPAKREPKQVLPSKRPSHLEIVKRAAANLQALPGAHLNEDIQKRVRAEFAAAGVKAPKVERIGQLMSKAGIKTTTKRVTLIPAPKEVRAVPAAQAA